MKSATKGLARVIIGIIYIIWGIAAPVSALKALIALDLNGIITAAVGVLMLIAGIYGLLGIKKSKARSFGVVIFVFALISVALALPTINFTSIITAVLAWLFIVAVK